MKEIITLFCPLTLFVIPLQEKLMFFFYGLYVFETRSERIILEEKKSGYKGKYLREI